MIRWLSLAVIAYMVLGIVWWGLLLHRKNLEIHDLKTATATQQELQSLADEQSRQTAMILGEGIVLGCSLLLGIFIIYRSASKEIQSAKQQSDFLLSVSHELKSPIAAIKLALQTLTRSDLPPEKEEKFLKSALKDNGRLEKLVQNILLSANLEGSSLELYKTPVDLSLLTSMLVTAYQAERPNVSWDLLTHPAPVIVPIDEQGIRQALSNILDNALKYTDDVEPIRIKTRSDTDTWSCHITNSGPMISAQDKVKIFKKFYRGANQQVRQKEGTGIGLYIANEIVKAHNGRIMVTSDPDLTEFTISLPIHE